MLYKWWGVTEQQCKDPIITVYCPKSCDEYIKSESCEKYACIDAPNKFEIAGFGIRDCIWVQRYDACSWMGVEETCRGTCDYCGLPWENNWRQQICVKDLPGVLVYNGAHILYNMADPWFSNLEMNEHTLNLRYWWIIVNVCELI